MGASPRVNWSNTPIRWVHYGSMAIAAQADITTESHFRVRFLSSSSLKLIRVGGLALSVSTNPSEFGDKRSLQGRFSYAGREYALRITDPAYEEMYLRRPDGSYGVGKRLLTVSLGGMFHGFGYKLIAAIIEP